MSFALPRRYWLTGASNGIGAALAEEILKSGAHLAVSSRSAAPLKVLSKRYPGQVMVVAGDLTNSQTVREIGEQIAKDWGSLDSVILNAGTCEYVDARQLDASIIEHVVRTNLLASSYCIEAAVPLLRAGTAPLLVGMASSATYLPLPRAEANGTSKAGLRYLFESLRIDLAADGIEVTMISPSLVDTPSAANNDVPIRLSWPVDQAARHIFDELKRRPPEIALPALFMAALWPLPKMPDSGKLAIGKRMIRSQPPIKDQP
ncbi:3-phenylpropionate-dihydrodiol/cinnamic acid-dihydrodiol dehydrogenase [Pseudomonas fluorescens]|uniref:3-phenylpropionate-dihydrodiol/cinnamic acid-dihydrodiol dehydrogenase n=1 Tax=Pseudomonas fluorescens TaxID=294 RepID=A0A5E7PZ09_PSEFL|nr:SDR family oxidoreductase [Pseudomonas fluorescens]VVN29827.1 3-phenylpropionate-dihydrodiol/cinnamic acid-dihydrodiol dehydrogenase [Pseudomonas fluorescens]VVP54280.1 3-phenylpropionate-dihydrodiol/cinnamic acid-dihydrodiol dehydrogenase [Pseudomonas fluorescens]